jgi:hypothetical protein
LAPLTAAPLGISGIEWAPFAPIQLLDRRIKQLKQRFAIRKILLQRVGNDIRL